MTWTAKTLDQLGEVSRGKSKHRPRDAEHLYGGPYPFVQTGDVKHAGLYLTKHKQTYSDAGLAQSRLWPAGTLCVTIAANIADTSILSYDACFPDSVIGFIADKNEADTRFIKYLFDAALKKQYMGFTQGAAQDNLSQKKLLSINFLVPKVEVQTRIADVISRYDDLIEINRRRIELLEQSAHLLYREWFVHFRFPGHEHVEIQDGAPVGWKERTAIDAVDVFSGGTPKTKTMEYWGGDIPFFTPKDATNIPYVYETEKWLTEEGLNSCNSKFYQPDTLFITARGTVGKLNLALVPMAMNQSCYALKGKDGFSQYYLYCAMNNAVNHLKAKAGGAVFDAIIIDTFKRIPFMIPPKRLMDDFEDFVTPAFSQIKTLVTQNQKLTQARDLLLPRLMNGEIAV